MSADAPPADAAALAPDWRGCVVNGAILTGAVLLVCALAAYPTWSVSGTPGLIAMGLSGFLTILPGWVVFLLAALYRNPRMQASLILLGSVFRMLFVAVGLIAVGLLVKTIPVTTLALWLIVMYFLTLAVETALLLRDAGAFSGSPSLTNSAAPTTSGTPHPSGPISLPDA